MLLRRVELEDDASAEELGLVLRRGLERGLALVARLNEKRSPFSRDREPVGGVGAGVDADELVQNLRADGDRAEGGYLRSLWVETIAPTPMRRSRRVSPPCFRRC